MKYRNLIDLLNYSDQECFDDDVVVYIKEKDEYYPVTDFTFNVGDDVLDDGHPVLIV